MPAELLREASRRLRVAALGGGLAFAITIILNNLTEVTGWYSFPHLAFRNVVSATMITISATMIWIGHSGRLTPARLLEVALAYEVVVAFAISIGDHLEPLSSEALSRLCVWIVRSSGPRS